MSTPSDTTTRTDVVVVGAGIAGLVAARRVADAGLDVVLVDPSEPGGRGRTDRRGDVLFNRGPHALYLGGPAHRTLEALGVPLDGGAPGRSGAAVYRDRVSLLPQGLGSMVRTDLLSPRGKLAAGTLLARFGRIRAAELAGVSFADWLDGLDLPSDARAAVEMLSRVSTYTNAPELASADMVVGQMQMAMRLGVRYLDGGWQRMVDVLAAGRTVVHGSAVAARGDATGVEVFLADERRIGASAAVLAAGTPEAASALLSQPFATGPAVHAACLDLATSVAPRMSLLLGMDEPLYLSAHTPSARLAPDGVHVVHAARYLAPGDDGDPVARRAELAAHAARAGLTADTVIDSRYLHRMTVVGAMAVARDGGLPGRIAVDAPFERNVFLAGDWVGPVGHLLDASVASADDAARRAVAAARAVTLVGR